jgi:WD40 repeat protein
MSGVPAPASPYKGLAAFEDSAVDALLFFGRDRDSQVIAANLMASRLTVLFGPTGVGKTSVLRAGVAYKLRQEAGVDVRIHSSWIGDPGEAFANLIPSTGRDIYLMLDQFEEFFLYHEQDRSFVGELADVIRRPDLRVNVLIGIREDALALLDGFKAAIPNLLSNRLRLENLDRASGAAAIRGPLERYNELVPAESRVDLEPALVDAVLDEVAAGRVELAPVGRGVVTAPTDDDRIEAPYLQLVMSRLWEVEAERGSKLLRRETLTELGGATQIVQDHLEHAMADLSPRQKDAAAAMYNFLVTPSGSKIAHRTRDLAGYAEIGEQEAADVLRQLAAERIVRASSENGAARYEIYHDVLADAVAGWGARYRAERAVHDAERRRRRAFGVATAALVSLVLVAAIAVFALVERSHSRAQAQRARARELAAAASSFLDVNPQTSIKLAMRAAQLERGEHEEEVLRDALRAALQREVLHANGPVRIAHFDPAGGHIVTGSEDGNVRVYKVGSSTPERILDLRGPVTAATYDDDGRLILAGGRDGTARIWGKADSPLRELEAGGPVTTAFFAIHSKRVLTIARTGLIRLWRTRDGKLLRTIRTSGKARPKGGAVSPGGGLLLTFGNDRHARLYSLLTGLLVKRLDHKGLVHCASFSPNGSSFLTCSHEGVVRVWSTVTDRLIRVLRGPEPGSSITDAVFSPNGILVAAAVADGTARIWEARTGFQMGIMFGHLNPTTKIAFNPSGRSIATGSRDTKARTAATSGKPVQVLLGHTGAINSVEFSPDGRSVLTSSDDGTARLWDSGTEPELRAVARQSSLTAFAVSADGSRVIVGDRRGVARVREVGNRRVLSSVRVHRRVTAVAFGANGPIVATRPTLSLAVSPRTKRVARGMVDGSVTIGGGGRLAQVLPARGPGVTALGFSPDEKLLATGDRKGFVRFWDLSTGRVRTFPAHDAAITSVMFSPNGKLLLTASVDHEARIWNVRGRLQRVIRWHFGPLGGASFSPDARWVVTAGPSTAGVGSASSGRRPFFLHGHRKPLIGAAFAGRNGQTIVTASKDGTIRVYHCEICGGIDELLLLAKRRLRSS